MKKLVILIGVCLSLSIPNLAVCEDWTGNINLVVGSKSLEEEDWEPVEEHDEAGILLDFKQKGWPASIAFGILASSEEQTVLYYYSGIGWYDTTLEAETREMSFGVKKIWDNSPAVRPFIGFGIALIEAEIKASASGASVSDDDDVTGFWFSGGIYFTLGQHFNLGLNLRWSQAEVTLAGVDAEAGGGHAGLLIGYHW